MSPDDPIMVCTPPLPSEQLHPTLACQRTHANACLVPIKHELTVVVAVVQSRCRLNLGVISLMH